MIPDLEIKKLAEGLHKGDKPLWHRLKMLLKEKGVDGEVYQFALDYLHTDVSQGVFAEWNNVTGEVRTKHYRKQVATALLLQENLKDT